MNQPLVSIIIPFYNEEELLERCLMSVKLQTYQNLEVILINDGSVDKSLLIAEKFEHEFQICKILSLSNIGHAGARNAGLIAASGAYLTFLDADDELEEKAIEILIRKIIKEESDLAICRFSIINKKGSIELIGGWKDRLKPIHHSKDLIFEMFNHGLSESVWAKLFRSDIAKKIRFVQDLWFDDRPFLFEYLFHSQKVSFIEDSLLKIYKRDTSITRRVIESKRIIDADRTFEKELIIAQKYYTEDLNSLKNAIVYNYFNVLVDNYLILIIDRPKVKNIQLVRKTYLQYLRKFSNYIDENSISFSFKKKFALQLLQSPSIIGWHLPNALISIFKKERFQQLLKLK